MYPLLEAIRIKDGVPENLDHHYRRMKRSLEILFGSGQIPPLKEILGPAESFPEGVYKCRLLYSNTGYSIEFLEYKKKKIERLIVVEKAGLTYEFKYSDRSAFDNLIEGIGQDAEIIISRNGLITDTRYTNIALLKKNTWYTPAEPLLKGTQRELLLDKMIIEIKNINKKDLSGFSKIRLFNAMMPWEDCIEMDIDKINMND